MPNFTDDACLLAKQVFDQPSPKFRSISGGTNNSGDQNEESLGNLTYSSTISAIEFGLTAILVPVLCVVGVMGNIINVVVLSRRRMVSACRAERASRAGLVGLAVSDLLSCLASLGVALHSAVRERSVLETRPAWLYVTMFGPFLQNALMRLSTWFTVLLAVERYVAICRPLHARHLVSARVTRSAVMCVCVSSVLLEFPTLWTYRVELLPCSSLGIHYYYLDRGPFVSNKNLKTGFTYLWTLVGFLIPVLILAYCNIHLIKALRDSHMLGRQCRADLPRRNSSYPPPRLTLTLVSIVCAYVLLVSPSELIHFFFYVAEKEQGDLVRLSIAATNVLQTLNVSLNFALYCAVNSQFRGTCHDVTCKFLALLCCAPCVRSLRGQGQRQWRCDESSPTDFGRRLYGSQRMVGGSLLGRSRTMSTMVVGRGHRFNNASWRDGNRVIEELEEKILMTERGTVRCVCSDNEVIRAAPKPSNTPATLTVRSWRSGVTSSETQHRDWITTNIWTNKNKRNKFSCNERRDSDTSPYVTKKIISHDSITCTSASSSRSDSSSKDHHRGSCVTVYSGSNKRLSPSKNQCPCQKLQQDLLPSQNRHFTQNQSRKFDRRLNAIDLRSDKNRCFILNRLHSEPASL